MDAISYSYADKQAKRIKKIINEPDSTSGVVTVPSTIATGETITIPAGRTAILPDVTVQGDLLVEGTVFIPTGSTYTQETIKTEAISNIAGSTTVNVTDIVSKVGNQDVGGIKNFTSSPTAPTPTAGDNSTKVATTAYVSESPQVCKAWVNFNGVPLNGTYSQSGTTITVTMTDHKMETGMIANLDFTSGTATDGIDFVVTSTGANTFTVIGKTSVTTSGNVTRNCYIRKAFNVSSITDNGVGDYTVNFTTAMQDANYNMVMSCQTVVTDGRVVGVHTSISPTTSALRVQVDKSQGGLLDSNYILVSVFR